MRARKKDQKNLMKVGVFVAGLTAVLMIMITSIGKENSIFESKVDIVARVGNVSNLKPGSYVELKGIRIGTVTKIEIISEDEVEIHMRVMEKETKWIKDDSKVAISTAGLVGDKYVEIHKGSKEAGFFEPGKDILYSEEVTDMKKILDKGDSIATTTDKILMKLDNILHKLDDGKTIVEMVNALNKSSKNLENITSELQKANIGQAVQSFGKTSASMENILTRIEKGPGTMNSLIYDESVHDDLRALLGGAQRNKVIKYFIRESIKKADERKPIKD